MRSNRTKTGFTIVELLTVMSIIIILISLLLPSLNAVKRYSKEVVQKGRFRNIDSGLEMFQSDNGEYPDSSAQDLDGDFYCGAMKLGEVMAGQDGLGYHPDSRLTANGLDATGTIDYYPPIPTPPFTPAYIVNLRSRTEYLHSRDIEICTLEDLYGVSGTTNPFKDPNNKTMLSDAFTSVANLTTGKRMGMPILYYRANTSKLSHDVDTPTNTDNIYNFEDNQALLFLGLPWEIATMPPLWSTGTAGTDVFYQMTKNNNIAIERPHNKDSYILISAGWDGVYGTRDDVFNFRKN